MRQDSVLLLCADARSLDQVLPALMYNHEVIGQSRMKPARLILVTLTCCLIAIFAFLSVHSSRQAARERGKQEAILRFMEEQEREDEKLGQERAQWRQEHPEELVHQPEPVATPARIDVDAEIGNLKSSDHDTLNSAIMRLDYAKACRALPDLMEVLRSNSDDYLAGMAAQAITNCKQPETYPVVVEEFLRRTPQSGMLYAVGQTGTQDDRVYARLFKLINEPNPDPDLRRDARRAKQQLDIHLQAGGR